MSFLLKKVEEINQLEAGKALDLGSGSGKDVRELVAKGWEVEAVDREAGAVKSLQNIPNITAIETNIETFLIKENYFDLILASNSLPFIGDSKTIFETLKKAVAGLKDGGVLAFSLFGPKDEWNGVKPNIAFIEYNEILDLLNKLPLEIQFQSTELGYGPTMAGPLKFWHIHKFVCKK